MIVTLLLHSRSWYNGYIIRCMIASLSRTTPTLPSQAAGKWVAWTHNGLYILGAGDTPDEARKAAEAHGPRAAAGWAPGREIAYEWTPPAGERFIAPLLP